MVRAAIARYRGSTLWPGETNFIDPKQRSPFHCATPPTSWSTPSQSERPCPIASLAVHKHSSRPTPHAQGCSAAGSSMPLFFNEVFKLITDRALSSRDETVKDTPGDRLRHLRAP